MMKISSVKNGRQGRLYLKAYDVEAFVRRIREDRNNALISDYRRNYRPNHPSRYRRYEEIPQIYAAMELQRQPNGAMGMAANNGVVVLEVKGLMNAAFGEKVRDAAMSMSNTLAAFVGATGQEVIILVRVTPADGVLPTNETEAEAFYVEAYRRMVRIYDAVLPLKVTRVAPTMRYSFLLPYDPQARLNLAAEPYPIRTTDDVADDEDVEKHLLALPEKRDADEVDMTAYMNYERVYEDVVEQVNGQIQRPKHYGNEYYKDFVTGMATALCKLGWPEEETVCHLWRHLTYKDWPGLTEDFVRTVVNAVYAEDAAEQKMPRQTSAPEEPLMQQVIRRMESRYVLRYNTVMGYTEYRTNHTWITPWAPVTDKVINTFTTDLQLAGLKVWDRDVRRYVYSTRIREHNPIEHYLYSLHDSWDGRDHIGALAATVPTPYPELWEGWFHKWFLAMVAQWLGRDVHYGNSIVPLLISDQGMHKSAFCRSLLPQELRRWGYTDNLSLAEERKVHLAMSQMLLINLDEFNRISPQKQQGFLKNIVQLASVKVQRPHARHTEDVPRLASFIATTNMPDVLADPTGSRRFVGVEVTGDIDMSQTPNYEQLYAQAMAEHSNGERYWFDDDESKAVMAHNRRFQHMDTLTQFFLDHFEVAVPEERGAVWVTATEVLVVLKKHLGGLVKATSAIAFGRTLRNVPGMHNRRTKNGVVYCVKLRK